MEALFLACAGSCGGSSRASASCPRHWSSGLQHPSALLTSQPWFWIMWTLCCRTSGVLALSDLLRALNDSCTLSSLLPAGERAERVCWWGLLIHSDVCCSDMGTMAPERCVFGIMLDVSSFLGETSPSFHRLGRTFPGRLRCSSGYKTTFLILCHSLLATWSVVKDLSFWRTGRRALTVGAFLF